MAMIDWCGWNGLGIRLACSVGRMATPSVTFALCVLFTPIYALSTRLPTSSSFQHLSCQEHQATYTDLVSTALANYKMQGLTIDDIYNLHGWDGDPQVLVVNNTVYTVKEPHLNVAANLIPLLKKLSRVAHLPDLILAGNIMDQPEDEIDRGGGPWFGYCNIRGLMTNLVYPASNMPVEGVMSCGKKCVPFTEQDSRETKAVFLGSSTGWASGRRAAVVQAGLLHPTHVYSGYTALLDIGQDVRDSQHPAIKSIKTRMTLTEQIRQFRYIINVDGHCAALRLSNEAEWYYPLLQPYVHYVPVRFSPQDPEPLHDIVRKIDWANAHPVQMAQIVRNAQNFAWRHLSEQGLNCYALQLFDQYSSLFSDQSRLQQQASEGHFETYVQHTDSV